MAGFQVSIYGRFWVSTEVRTPAIPTNKSSSVDVLIAYVPRAVGEFLILTHFTHRSLHEYRDETSTSILDVTRCG
jgi:hypothetical protein